MTDTGMRASEPLLIGSLLRMARHVSPMQEIVYRDVHRCSYQHLEQRIGRLAQALHQRGVQSGDTVAVMDWDSHRYLECYFAVPMMGAILMTVNLRLSSEQIRYCLHQSQASVLLLHHDFVPLISSLMAQLPNLRQIILLEPDHTDTELLPQALEYEALVSSCKQGYAFSEFDEQAIATTFYTTGTTGLPKGVCYSHRQIVVHTLAVMGALASAQHGQSFRHGDVYMPMTPMFHVHAWGIPYVATLLGVKQVYPGRYEPARLLALRARERVTYSHCVPTILQMLLSAPESAQTNLEGWKITVGGAALGAALATAARQRGIEIFAAYGMSETCPFLCLSRLTGDDPHADPAQELTRRCRTGLPLPMIELQIVDEQGRALAHDGQTMGELVARAPWLAQGYLGDAGASDELWQQGYLHTRDIATIDDAGYVQIRDRLKDVIKSGGEWVSSLLLEDLIGRHAQVAEVAVIPMADERWGERPLAIVVLKAGSDATQMDKALRDHLQPFVSSGLILRYAIPAVFRFVEALPKTSVGKLDKKVLRAQFPC